jgi:protein-S-isoprenylcysteine O-methyltransferase Ste14
MHAWQVVSGGLLAACLFSFAWAMRRFFLQPAGLTGGMQAIKYCGIVFGLLHIAAIAATPGISSLQGLAGAALYTGALALFWWAIGASGGRRLSAAFSPDLPGHLVAQGPYQFIRHPLYCSYLLCWAAGWAVTARWWLAPTVGVMLVIYLVAARQEEKKFMRSPLAESYLRYRARTGLLVPNPLKLFSSARKQLSQNPA